MTFCVIFFCIFLSFNFLCLFLSSISVIFSIQPPFSFFYPKVLVYFRYPIPSRLFSYHFSIIQVIYNVSGYFVRKTSPVILAGYFYHLFFLKKGDQKKVFRDILIFCVLIIKKVNINIIIKWNIKVLKMRINEKSMKEKKL